MIELKIEVPREELEAFCRKYHIRKLAFFGSVLREDFKPESDIDVLVEFESGKTPGLAFFGMHAELAGIFNRNVDLLTFKGVETSRNPIRRKVIHEYDAVQLDIIWDIVRQDLPDLVRELEKITPSL